jgi:hypothetical protein
MRETPDLTLTSFRRRAHALGSARRAGHAAYCHTESTFARWFRILSYRDSAVARGIAAALAAKP